MAVHQTKPDGMMYGVQNARDAVAAVETTVVWTGQAATLLTDNVNWQSKSVDAAHQRAPARRFLLYVTARQAGEMIRDEFKCTVTGRWTIRRRSEEMPGSWRRLTPDPYGVVVVAKHPSCGGGGGRRQVARRLPDKTVVAADSSRPSNISSVLYQLDCACQRRTVSADRCAEDRPRRSSSAYIRRRLSTRYIARSIPLFLTRVIQIAPYVGLLIFASATLACRWTWCGRSRR